MNKFEQFTEEEIDILFRKIDSNGSKLIDLTEFQNSFIEDSIDEMTLKQCFIEFDTNGDGFI